MQNKKTAIVLVTVAVTLFVVVAFIFLQKPAKDLMSNKFSKSGDVGTGEVTGELPELVCEYKNDQDAYNDAIASQRVGQCECIENADLKDVCETTSMDMAFYDRALTHLDGELCEKINSETQREACKKVVSSLVAQLEEKDSQYLADMYLATHNEKAIEQLEQLIQSDKGSVDNFVALALAYAEKGLKEQEQGRDRALYINKAFEALENAKGVDDRNSEVYRVEAYVNEIKPNYSAAVGLYTQAIELDKSNILAYAGRGHVNRMIGVLESAVADFEAAARLDTKNENVFIYTNLCNLEHSRGNVEAAIKNCKIVVAQENVDPVFKSEASQILGVLYMQNKDLAQARSTLLTAKTLTPNDPNLYVTFSKLGIYEGDYVYAEDQAHKAIELSPTKAMSYLALSQALYMQEKYNEAIQAAEKGVNLVADDVSLLVPSKPAVERDLNYSIANSYKYLGDVQKQKEYEQRGKNVFENNRFNF